jgi:hypothetical protein
MSQAIKLTPSDSLNPNDPLAKLSDTISSTQLELAEAEHEAKHSDEPAKGFVNKIATLRERLNSYLIEKGILEERVKAARVDEAANKHSERIAGVKELQAQRMERFASLDKLIAQIGKELESVAAIDDKLKPLISGTDSYFPVNRKSHVPLLIDVLKTSHPLLDDRWDKSIPRQTLTQDAERLHFNMLQELEDAPRRRAEGRRRQREEALRRMPVNYRPPAEG